MNDRDRANLLTLAVEQSPAGIAVIDREGNLQFVNNAFARLHGCTPEELAGKPLSMLHAPEPWPSVEGAHRQDRETGAFRGEIGHARGDGSTFPTLMQDGLVHTVEGTCVGRILTLCDETGWRDTERRLLDDQERYALAEEIAQVGHWESDRVENRNVWSGQVYKMFGRDPAQVRPTYEEFLTCVHPADRDRVERAVEEALSRAGRTEMEYRIVRPDGEERHIRSVMIVSLAPDGKPAKAFGILQDITERKRIEEALLKSEEKWRCMTENSPDFILVLDSDGVIQFINHSQHQPKDQVIGASILDFTAEESKHVVTELLEGVRRTGQPDCRESWYVSPEGVRRLFEMRAGAISRADRVVGFMLNATDITDRKRMQEEIARTQHLESIGILAGGIAHDFNNILTAMVTNLSLVKMFADSKEDIYEVLSDAEAATLRAVGLSRQLLALSKGGSPIKKPACLLPLIRETTAFCLSGSNVRCEFSLPEDLWAVDVDEGQIGQAIQNVVINADQAMPGGGTLRVRAENLVVNEGEYPPLQNGRYIRVSIEDRGNGIPEEWLPRIFDPFFSTKERGRGLGLAITFPIIKRHGGHVHVESQVGVGSTFHILLPASGSPPPAGRMEGEKPLTGEGRILLIDDDMSIRKSAGNLLRRLGYEVQFAADGQEGIDCYRVARQAGKPFHAVIMDLTIPGGMGGKEAVEHLKRIDPEAKVIVSSGYAEDPVMSNFRAFGFSGVAPKPYTADMLAEILKRVIEPPHP